MSSAIRHGKRVVKFSGRTFTGVWATLAGNWSRRLLLSGWDAKKRNVAHCTDLSGNLAGAVRTRIKKSPPRNADAPTHFARGIPAAAMNQLSTRLQPVCADAGPAIRSGRVANPARIVRSQGPRTPTGVGTQGVCAQSARIIGADIPGCVGARAGNGRRVYTIVVRDCSSPVIIGGRARSIVVRNRPRSVVGRSRARCARTSGSPAGTPCPSRAPCSSRLRQHVSGARRAAVVLTNMIVACRTFKPRHQRRRADE